MDETLPGRNIGGRNPDYIRTSGRSVPSGFQSRVDGQPIVNYETRIQAQTLKSNVGDNRFLNNYILDESVIPLLFDLFNLGGNFADLMLVEFATEAATG